MSFVHPILNSRTKVLQEGPFCLRPSEQVCCVKFLILAIEGQVGDLECTASGYDSDRSWRGALLFL